MSRTPGCIWWQWQHVKMDHVETATTSQENKSNPHDVKISWNLCEFMETYGNLIHFILISPKLYLISMNTLPGSNSFKNSQCRTQRDIQFREITLQGTITYSTIGEKENHRLKKCLQKGDLWLFPRGYPLWVSVHCWFEGSLFAILSNQLLKGVFFWLLEIGRGGVPKIPNHPNQHFTAGWSCWWFRRQPRIYTVFMHVLCLRHCEEWDKLPIHWCRIFVSRMTSHRFLFVGLGHVVKILWKSRSRSSSKIWWQLIGHIFFPGGFYLVASNAQKSVKQFNNLQQLLSSLKGQVAVATAQMKSMRCGVRCFSVFHSIHTGAWWRRGFNNSPRGVVLPMEKGWNFKSLFLRAFRHL